MEQNYVGFFILVLVVVLIGYFIYRYAKSLNAKYLLSEFMPPLDDEEIVNDLKGDAYNISPNIFSRFFAFITKILSWILGVPRKAHIVVTTKRVIVVEITRFFWIFNWTVTAISFTPRGIVSSGFAQLRSFVFFRSSYLLFGTIGRTMYVKSDGGRGKVDKVNQAIARLTNKFS